MEPYFYNFGAFHEENSRIRIIVTKVFSLMGLLDDTYDVRAIMEECQMLDEAMQTWNESAISFLPEYLRALYIRTLSNFNEIEYAMEPCEKYRMAYIIKQYKWQ